MNIEKLVADRELCERIPAGEFLDTAFCWHYTEVAGFVCGNGCKQFCGKQWVLERSTSGKITRYRQRGEVIYPAPMLEEVMAELPAATVCGKEHHSDWYVSYWRIGCVADTERKGAATAALRLWLQLSDKSEKYQYDPVIFSEFLFNVHNSPL
jgi:hypothetical protein